ncbi:hypothetical protein [Nocardioides pantholopis]|uniref:hypothetical protein n=1 Tax=Nocardioides pantholopis TaxID=2483798 RepID=UPI000F08421D|nr:hypothetical protein [Nocardioides pantholopis]
MKNKFRRTTMVGALASTALMVAAPAAMAAGPLTVGGATTPSVVAITASNVGSFTFATDYDVPATCTTATVGGEIYPGTAVVDNAKIGEIQSLTFSGCTATGLNYPVTITKTGSVDWDLIVDGTPASGATADLEITNVSAQMRSTGSAPYVCDLAAATAAGSSVPGSFDPTTQRLSIASAAGAFPLDLTAAGGVTCGGQIFTGDRAQMAGTFAVSTGGAGSINY